ncbi:MAG: DASS family sodium-coupled anion symporter [Prevotellaceae bacterium]|jgi:anion transporter|nr:DASS family sodium-coupled anion symporter [Prevotellaceae bacterium]
MALTTNKDLLDMNNYRIEQLPNRPKSRFERWMAYTGAPLSIAAFVLLYCCIDIPFLNNINEENLTGDALKRFKDVGILEFCRINYAMLAIFVASVILWITETVPNYLTSLFVIIGVVLTGVVSEKTAYAQLGHPVMWLNILSFVLASMLVKTQVAKRFALWFVVNFGKNATWIFISFIVINIVLSAFISATTAKAAILLPIFMVIAAIYGATGGNNRNNFGRNIVLQNLFQINIGASGFMTGSGANLLAVSLIMGAGVTISYQEWFAAAFPLCLLIIIIGWIVGTKIMFPLKKEEREPQISGGMLRLREELQKMGRMKIDEYKAVAIFVGVLFMWATKGYLHSISETSVAFIGAVVALIPYKIGIVKWNDIDIPWHLMIFSAGAYTLGTGLDATNIAGTMVDSAFNSLGISDNTPFWILYLMLTGAMLFSAILFQSKTMRALIFIPISIGVAQKFGYPVMSLAFPVALLIEHVYVLPFNSKPAALLYTTDQYSWADTFKFGITMMIISWILMFVWGETVLQWLGHVPNGLF